MQIHSNDNPESNDYSFEPEKSRYAGLTISDKVVTEFMQELLKFEDINIMKAIASVPVLELMNTVHTFKKMLMQRDVFKQVLEFLIPGETLENDRLINLVINPK